MNRVHLIGRLGRDPEVRATQNGNKIANLSLATSERTKDGEKTEWHRVVIFGKVAEIAEKCLRKGSEAAVEGKLETRKWQDQSGQDRYTTEVIVGGYGGKLHLIGGKPSNTQGGGQPDRGSSHDPNLDDMDSDIPFIVRGDPPARNIM